MSGGKANPKIAGVPKIKSRKRHRNQTSQCRATPFGRLTKNDLNSSHLRCLYTSALSDNICAKKMPAPSIARFRHYFRALPAAPSRRGARQHKRQHENINLHSFYLFVIKKVMLNYNCPYYCKIIIISSQKIII